MLNPEHSVPATLRSFPKRRAFSLVEVVIAIGVVAFSMVAMLGTLPVGLKSSQHSRTQVAMANISRQLQGELQQISFQDQGNTADVQSIASLGQSQVYYTQEGTRTTDPGAAYFLASFATAGVSLPGLAVDPSNARSVSVKLTYPVSVPAGNRQESSFTLLLAKQKTS